MTLFFLTLLALSLGCGIFGLSACLGGHEARRDNALDAMDGPCTHPPDWQVFVGVDYAGDEARVALLCLLCNERQGIPVPRPAREGVLAS